MTGLTDAERRSEVDAILDACQTVVDRDGDATLTLWAIAAELHAEPAEVHRVFRDEAEMLTALADRVLGEIIDGFEPSEDWRETIIELATRGRAAFLAHPGFARRLAQAPDVLPNQERIVEIALGALRRAGLGDEDAALAYHALADLIAGAASLEAEAGLGRGVYDAWRRAYAGLPPDRFPNATALAPYLFPDPEREFRFVLAVLVGGVEALAAS
jgi:TetR/AcrR family tetracycline transcriptional repressor